MHSIPYKDHRTAWILVLLLLSSLCLPLQAQDASEKSQAPMASSDSASAYDATLAERLGADAYGMRQYVMAFLHAGPNRDGTAEERAALQKAHLENIGRLAEEGKLALAGPFLDDAPLRGIYIFATDAVEQAREWTATDPAIQAGSLRMELRPWYGSAGLMEVGRVHKRIAQQNP